MLIRLRSRTGSSMHVDEPRRRSNETVRPTVVNPSHTNGFPRCRRHDCFRPLSRYLVARPILMLKHVTLLRQPAFLFSIFDSVYGQRLFISALRFACQSMHYGLISFVYSPTVSVHISLLLGRHALRGWIQIGVHFFHHGCFLSVQNNTLGHTLGPLTGMGKWRNGEYYHQQALWPEYVSVYFCLNSLTNPTHSLIHHTSHVSLTSMNPLRVGFRTTYLLKQSQLRQATFSPLLTSRSHPYGNFSLPRW
jgi:hypothetical protein